VLKSDSKLWNQVGIYQIYHELILVYTISNYIFKKKCILITQTKKSNNILIK
jgi:hypothetical protein